MKTPLLSTLLCSAVLNVSLLPPPVYGQDDFTAELRDCAISDTICIRVSVTNQTRFELHDIQITMKIRESSGSSGESLCMGSRKSVTVYSWGSGMTESIKWSPLAIGEYDCIVDEVVVSVEQNLTQLAVFRWR